MTGGTDGPRDDTADATATDDARRAAIVTVSYNSHDVLPPFLASTPAASASPVEVVVADNDSADADALRSVTERSGARFLELGENRGYGAAVNRAVATLDPGVRWVLVSNPDVVLGPLALDRMIDTASADPTIGAVGPKVLEPTGEVYPSARLVPSLRTGLGHALFANVWPGNPWTRRYRQEGVQDTRRDAGWLSGACVLVRRDVFDRLGGFDEGYFMYFEDVDLGWRLGRLGLRNVYEPAATATHVGGTATQGSSERMRRAHHESAYRFLAGKYRAWWLWPLRAALRVALAVRAHLTHTR
ncbi:glycosyltransferase family 2 protein [Curtobacterium sp. Csp1]|uniref:glycosyltransferase family 2 protein n=1 Tax=unclassified Curtobacterium TaxID=257496 RepID=UPI000E2C11DC|nr:MULTISPECIES: glycosyltransferase family 2 protein [unclassified Curtobacterium]QKS13873.1 glycosyltransferase family 2 protein [Curtobacterium sp. csp3]QKS20917.1 glycosyltransferase family 2 protein [Curtobacterium sp. Csp1]RDI00073.1 N-acetylglucosaminyl-diphospho-decaprenol L-rhamnosyltransferase [Curtobacterium sp. AG1037]